MNEIDVGNATISDCKTDYGEKVIEYYSKDVEEHQIPRWMKEHRYTRTHRESIEGGEYVMLFVEKK